MDISPTYPHFVPPTFSHPSPPLLPVPTQLPPQPHTTSFVATPSQQPARPPVRNRPILCYRCGDYGHFQSRCPLPEGSPPCRNCPHSKDHYTKDCPNPPNHPPPPPTQPPPQAPPTARLISIHSPSSTHASTSQHPSQPTNPHTFMASSLFNPSQSSPYCAAVTRSKGKLPLADLEPPSQPHAPLPMAHNHIDLAYKKAYEDLETLPPVFDPLSSIPVPPTSPMATSICDKLIRSIPLGNSPISFYDLMCLIPILRSHLSSMIT